MTTGQGGIPTDRPEPGEHPASALTAEEPAWQQPGRVLVTVGVALVTVVVILLVIWFLLGHRGRSAVSHPGPAGISMQCWEMGPEPCMERARVVAATYLQRPGAPRPAYWDINDEEGDWVCLARNGVEICFRPDGPIPSPDAFAWPSGRETSMVSAASASSRS
ncbi:MAG: hypothetical protein U0869_09010 [Chloroflexota bacterium]